MGSTQFSNLRGSLEASAKVNGWTPLPANFVSFVFRHESKRDLSEEDVAHWLKTFQAELASEAFTLEIAQSSEVDFKTDDRAQSLANFVSFVYRHELKREPSEEEIAPYVEALQMGLPPEAFILDVAKSPEACAKADERARSLVNFVCFVYRRELKRDPSDGDVAHWLQALQAGLTAEAFILNVAQSLEARTMADEQARSRADFVRFVYRHELKRDPSDEDVVHCVKALQAGLTPETFILSVVQSPEARAKADERARSLADFVRFVYWRELECDPSDEVVAHWLKALQAGLTPKALFLEITQGTEAESKDDEQIDFRSLSAKLDKLQLGVDALRLKEWEKANVQLLMSQDLPVTGKSVPTSFSDKARTYSESESKIQDFKA